MASLTLSALCTLACTSFSLSFVFEGAAVRDDDAARILVEFDDLEGERFALDSLRTIGLDQVLRRSECFDTFGERDDSALLYEFADRTFVDRTYAVVSFEGVPGVLFKLLVAERETTVFLVDLEDDDLQRSTDFRELVGVLDLLRPREVGDVYKTIDTFFDLYEDTEVGEVADLSRVARADGEALVDVFPWIFLELLETEAHLTLFAVKREDDSFDYVADLQEFLSRADVLRPRHFRDVDETFYARSNFDECTVVSEDNDLTLDLVAHLEVRVEAIPGMWLELLDTKSDALLSFVELEDNDVELLVEANNFAGVRYTAPREVGDVDETIDTTEVDEGTVRGDVLDDPFEDLTLLKLADDLSLLSFEFR